MAVQGVTTIPGGVAGSQQSSGTEMNKIDFLNLLIAQIQHQDPMSPMDNQQFVSQLTQFTSLDELTSIASKLDENMILTQSLNNTMMLGLVGREVTVGGDGVTVADGSVSHSKLEVAGAGQATIEVRDDSGQVVATYQETGPKGRNDIPWVGMLSDGEPAPDGEYSLSISVADGNDNPLEFVAYMSGPVECIRWVNNLALVEVGGQEYYVSEILAVNNT